jgi:hypothetical protein
VYGTAYERAIGNTYGRAHGSPNYPTLDCTHSTQCIAHGIPLIVTIIITDVGTHHAMLRERVLRVSAVDRRERVWPRAQPGNGLHRMLPQRHGWRE